MNEMKEWKLILTLLDYFWNWCKYMLGNHASLLICQVPGIPTDFIWVCPFLKCFLDLSYQKSRQPKPKCNLIIFFVNVFDSGYATQFPAQFPLKFFSSGYKSLLCQVILRESFLSTKPGWKSINHLIIKVCSFQEKIQVRAQMSLHLHTECSPRESGIWAALHWVHSAAELPSS